MNENLRQIWEYVNSFFMKTDIADNCHNEAELQHELGFWLRSNLPDGMVRFERPASYFSGSAQGLVKKEIDLVVSYPLVKKQYAIEIKFPRQGQHPEQMFQICRDLRFLEQLVDHGFDGGLFIIHVTDPLFYERGSRSGIYAHFRGGETLHGLITKPTGARDETFYIQGEYQVKWQSSGEGMVWIQAVTRGSLKSGEGFYLLDEVKCDKGLGIFAEDEPGGNVC